MINFQAKQAINNQAILRSWY